MSKMDVLARIHKTGEERIYPEAVFNNICDDTENPLEFIRYVELPYDGQPNGVQVVVQTQPDLTHQQVLLDEVLRLREENNRMKAALKPETKPKKSKKDEN